MTRTVRCPIASSLDVVGDRWVLQVVRDLLRGHRRFSDLERTVEGIPPSVLANRLKLLEREGVVRRQIYSDHPPRYEYILTAKGHSLGVVVGALASWGEKYMEHDRALVDEECGHGVTVVYHCTTCARRAPRSRVRFVDGAHGDVVRKGAEGE